MRVRRQSKKYSIWVVTLVSAIAILGLVPPIAAQTNPAPSAQSADLGEAERLTWQAEQLYNRQDYGAAIALQEQALTLREQSLSPHHPDVASSVYTLAHLYERQGNYSKAEPLYQRFLAIKEKALGTHHPHIASILNTLANLYRSQGNYSKAEPLYRRSEAIVASIPVVRPHKPSQQLAQSADLDEVERLNQQVEQMLYHEGKYSAAIPIAERVLAIRERVLGLHHYDVASSLHQLAQLYNKQGNYSKAEPLYRRSEAIWTDWNEAELLNRQVERLSSEGKYDAAMPLAKKVLAIYEKILGLQHSDVATSLYNLAVLYESQGNYLKAEPLYQRSLVIWEKALGAQHPYLTQSLDRLTALYWVQDDIPHVLKFLNSSSNIRESNLALILTTGSESRKRAYTTTISSETDSTVSLHIQSAPNNLQAARLALTNILRRKGRVLDALTDSLQALKSRLNP